MYFGTWVQAPAPGATDLKYHYSAVKGNSAAVVFNGTGFTFQYMMTSAGGIAEIRVDGVVVKQLSMKSATNLWKQNYTVSGLTAGQHTVQIIHISGSKIYVDGITIAP